MRVLVAALGIIVMTTVANAAPSFNCAKAKHSDEIAICANEALAATDVETTNAFLAMKAHDRAGALKAARAFLARRRACGSDTACIALSQQWALIQFGASPANNLLSPTRPVALQPAPKPAMLADSFQPNEHIIAASDDGIIKIGPHREGQMPDGLTYSIYSDGSGGVSIPGSYTGWDISCAADAMDDKRRCHFSSGDAGLFVYFDVSDDPQSVCLLGHDFPGRTGAIRIDKEAAVATDKKGCVSWLTVSGLATASNVTTRSVKWPYDYPVDRQAELTGFADALALTKHIHAHIDSMKF